MLILASASPRRRRLLTRMGVRFRAIRPDYAEIDPPGMGVRPLVKRHALEKALSAVPRVRDGVILAADTVVWLDGRVLGKPRSMASAERMLGRLAGRWHEVFTGAALLQVRRGRVERRRVFFDRTRVRIRPMTRERIRAYLRRIGPLDKAGAYAIQSSRARAVERIRGSWANAVGLPVEKLYARLNALRIPFRKLPNDRGRDS